jgi:hypothetical protein
LKEEWERSGKWEILRKLYENFIVPKKYLTRAKEEIYK